jgi:hypothetical protein
MTNGTERSECTIMDCSGEAEYGYWMPGLGQFSRAKDPEHDLLDDGDLAPYVCEGCRDRMAAGPHWDGERFVNPRAKLIADGGTELIERECNNRYVATASLDQERTGQRERMASDLFQYGDPLVWSRTPSSVAARRTRLIVSSFGGSSSIPSRWICRRNSDTSRRVSCAWTMALQTRSRAVMEPLICCSMSTQPHICCGSPARCEREGVGEIGLLLQLQEARNARQAETGTEQSGSDSDGN